MMTKILIEVEGSAIELILYHLDGEHARDAVFRLARGIIASDRKAGPDMAKYVVRFISCGERKIDVIKAIRQFLPLDLKIAKDESERGEHFFDCEFTASTAKAFVKELQRAGATAEAIKK